MVTFLQISSGSPCDNLKEYVLDRRCKGEEIISFLSQVASALHYFHINHIVHGDLRAEYVNVVTPQKVRVPTNSHFISQQLKIQFFWCVFLMS